MLKDQTGKDQKHTEEMDATSFTQETTLIPLKYWGNTSNKANKIQIKCVRILQSDFFKGSLGAHREPSAVYANNAGVTFESGREKARSSPLNSKTAVRCSSHEAISGTDEEKIQAEQITNSFTWLQR